MKEDGNFGIDRLDNCLMGVGFLFVIELVIIVEELIKVSMVYDFGEDFF